MSKENLYDKESHASSYNSSKEIWKDGWQRAKEFNVKPGEEILDIGTGPGILSIPLAKGGNSVTVVEPSIEMVKLLKENMKMMDVDNISIINSRFEDLREKDLGIYDIVIASYSLMMEDWRNAFIKMNNMAKKKVYLYWFAGCPTWELNQISLYPKVHGEEYKVMRKTDEIYSILTDLNISPMVRPLLDTHFSYRYDSMKSAVENMYRRMDVSRDDGNYDEIFEEYIRENYIKLEGEGYLFDDKTHYVEISWTPIDLKV